MIKVFSPSGWNFDGPVASLIKVASSGLRGADRQEFLKRASGAENIFLPYLDQVKFAADEEPAHLLAVGAHDAYSHNRNGDGFQSATCKAAHDTFVKHARAYRNHKNKDPQQSYGIVKLSAYNPVMQRIELLVGYNRTKEAARRNGGLVADKELEKLASGKDLAVSMSCALPGTLVKTLRRGYRPIESVREGEMVLTHRGRYRRVTAVLSRRKQHYVKIRTRFYGRQVLQFTPDHEFYVARYRDLPRGSWRCGSKDPTGMSAVTRKNRRHELASHARWVPCGDLREGDLLLMPIDRGNGDSRISKDEARLFGYYIAEGSIGLGGSQHKRCDSAVVYTCNKRDDIVSEIESLVSAGTKVSFNRHSNSDEALNVYVGDPALAVCCRQEIGSGLTSKSIPRRVYHAPAEIKLEFVSAWFNGDGWQDDKGLHWSTASRGLSLELQNLLASVGVPSSVYRIDHPVRNLTDGQSIKATTEYTVNVSNRYSGQFVGRSKVELRELFADKTTVFITGDYLAIPVKDVEFVEKATPVYDLQVDEDESFTAFGLAVHNCKIGYDECSWCHNKARTRDDYCTNEKCAAGGCKDNLSRLVKIGNDVHHLGVYNPYPVFFDISDVYRPADRTAYGGRADYLVKAAEDGGFFGVGGAKLAEDLGVSAPLAILLEPCRDLDPDSQHIHAQVKLAYALASLEQSEMLASEEAKRAFDADVQPEVALGEVGLDQPRLDKIAESLGALADQKIILPIRDFARFTKRAALAASAGQQLPGIYRRLLESGRIESAIAGNPFVPAEKLASASVRKAAEKLKPTHSLGRDEVVNRSRLSTLRGRPVPKSAFRKQAADDDMAGRLAQDYALYKLAALERIAETDDDFLSTSGFALRQNEVL